jgi:hypothetical protein
MEKLCDRISGGMMTSGGYLWALAKESELILRLQGILNRTVEHHRKNGSEEKALRYTGLIKKIEEYED